MKHMWSPNITTGKLWELAGQIHAANYITFTYKKIDPTGTGHTKALLITVQCKGYNIAKVLIDKDLTLNMLPHHIIDQLPNDQSFLKPSHIMIRAIDRTKRTIIEDIDLAVEIRPFIFQVTFQVMDIHPLYSMLLGRLWIHFARVYHLLYIEGWSM